jgi:PiT family inorganic phosphate transporter
MMMSKIVLLILLSITFDFLNGMRDGSNFAATIVSSRALSLRQSLWVAGVAVFIGPLVIGVSVAYTFGRNIVLPGSININEILAALLAGVAWNILSWWLSMPSSSTHAVLGGLLGAVIVGVGWGAILINGLERVLISLFISPLLGLLAGFLVTKLVFFLARYATPRINIFFRQVQLPTEIFLALSYGGNDAQKTMGLIPMGLVVAGLLPSFRVPVWVMLLSAGVTALGVILSGQRLIRTLGGRFYKIRPVHGFSSQLSAALVILGAALLGGPVSSSQVITSSILGVGSADRINQVRWRLAGSIIQSWLLTIPVCALLGGLSYLALVAMTGF